jgi:hypothetical protein
MEPALAVTGACWASGLIAAGLAVAWQLRLGVHAAMATSVALIWLGQPRVWLNVLAPEVYMPSLALLGGAAYLVAHWARRGDDRWLWTAALLYGAAAASRPQLHLAFPFFLLALRGRDPSALGPKVRASRRWLLAAGFVLLPQLYSWGFVWLRDRPDVAYNYIEQYNLEHGTLPDASAGAAARWRRLVWLTTAEQFRHQMGATLTGVGKKLRWLAQDVFQRDAALWAAGLLLVPLGAVLIIRRSPPSFWLLCGLGLASAIYVALFRVHGQSADLLPLLWAGAVFAGAAASPVFPRRAGGFRSVAAWSLLAVTVLWTLGDAPKRAAVGRSADAESFLAGADLAALPAGSVICSHWAASPPLWYEQCVRGRGRDVRVINAREDQWRRLAGDRPGQAVFATIDRSDLLGAKAVAHGGLWRFDRATENEAPHE